MTPAQRKLWLQFKLYSLALIRFFPIQLFILHLRRSWLFLGFWILLFGMTGGFFFQRLGIPYLFITPEYLEEVNPLSYFIVGLVLGLFTMAFHITSYIFYSHKFPFLATLSRPLYRFSFNNSIIPLSFFAFYVYQIVKELSLESWGWLWILSNVGGLIAGVITSVSITFSWFFSTLKPKVLEKIGDRLDKTLRMVIVEEKSEHKLDFEVHHRVVTYLKNFMAVRWARDTSHYPKSDLLHTLQAHNSNASIFMIIVAAIMVGMGYFADSKVLMIPAAASIVIMMTFYLLIVGALYSRFKSWTAFVLVIATLGLNYVSGFPQFEKRHAAFGLDYDVEPAKYTIAALEELSSQEQYDADFEATLSVLENWKRRTGEDKPKLVIINSSGGGLRSSLWSLAVLQELDSTIGAEFWKHCFMVTGSSGGMVGTAYFREIHGDVSKRESFQRMGRDLLNPVGFSLVSNDLFWSMKRFEDAGSLYSYDRGWALEQKLHENTGRVFPDRWRDYAEAEFNADIPWMVLSPTVINEGRRLLISNIGVSYLTRNRNDFRMNHAWEIDGVEFYPFFKNQRGDSLRTMSALRLSATFPYITPLTSMPSEPEMEVIDAGARDNNGFELSFRMVYEFRDWIAENTSGVVFVQLLANEPPSEEIAGSPYRTRFDDLVKPIGGVVNSFANLQGYSASELLHLSDEWLEFPVDIVPFQLMSVTDEEIALSWHLTEREKAQIYENSESQRIDIRVGEVKSLLHR